MEGDREMTDCLQTFGGHCIPLKVSKRYMVLRDHRVYMYVVNI